MDIEKLIEQLSARGLGNGTSLGYHSGLLDEVATALSTLQAENEKLRSEAEGMRSNWYKSVEEIQKLRAELEQVKRERDAAVEGLRVCSIENNKECQYCLYRTARSFCWNCTDGSNWKFRGQKED